jgi:hypothetical protein
VLNSDPERGAMCLADYGDERGLEPLSRAFDAYQAVEGDRVLANPIAIEIHAAIEDLGGAPHAGAAGQAPQGEGTADKFRRTSTP